jgi:PPP family 3-phenylpropionic acid transporter
LTSLALLGTPRWRAIVCFISLFVAVGASAPYLPVYYQSLGLPLEAIGLLQAVLALCALLATSGWGLLADRLHGNRYVLPTACLIAAWFAVILGLANQPAVAALSAVLFVLAYTGIGPVLDARALETVPDDRHRYSVMRAWGSAAFVASTVTVGVLIQGFGLRSLFVVLIAALIVTAVLTFGLRAGTAAAARVHMPRLSGLTGVLRQRALLSFFAAALLAWTANSAINAFFSIYLGQIGAPESLVGSAWAIGAAVEIPLMVAFPALVRRVGLERLILVGAALLVARAVVVAFVRDPVIVAFAQTLHGGGFALLLVGGITYVAGHAPRGASATAQGLLTGVVIGLAPAIGPGLGGLLAAQFGLNALFAVAVALGAVAVVGLALVLGVGGHPRRSEPTEGAQLWNAATADVSAAPPPKRHAGLHD